MVIRAKDQASRVLNGLSRSASAEFRRLQTAATLTAQRSSLDMAKVRQHYSNQILGQQKILNQAMTDGNKTRATAARQAIRDLGIMRQEEVLGIKQEQLAQREIMLTAEKHAAAKAAALDSKKAAASSAGQWIAGGALMVIAGAAGVKALHSMAMGAVEYQRQATLTLTQTDKVKTSVRELQGISTRVARSVGVPLEALQPALYDIFSSMDVNVKQAEQLLTAFAKEAVAGQVSIQDASRSTIGIMNAYHIPISKVNEVLDFQFQLVRKGVGTFEQFATTIGRAIPSAVRAGQSYQTLGAMMAFMTRNGVSAAMAAASSGRALDAFANPKVAAKFEDLGNVIRDSSSLSADALRKLGIDTNNVSVKIKDAHGNFRGFIPVMGELSAVLMKLPRASRAAVLQQLFKGAGGTTQAMRYFNLVLPRFQQQNELLKAMMHSTGEYEKAYAEMGASVAAKTVVLSNNWKTFKLELGEGALPVLSKLITVGTKVLGWLNDLSPTQKRAIAETMAFVSVVLTLSGVLVALSGTVKLVAAAYGIMQVSVGGIGSALSSLAGASVAARLGLVGLAAAAGAILAVKLNDSLHKSADEAERTGRMMTLGGKGGQLFAERVSGLSAVANEELTPAMRAARMEMYNTGQASVAAAKAAGGYGASIGVAEKHNRRYATSVAEVTKLTKEEEKAISDAARRIIQSGMEGLAPQQDRIAEATRNLRDAQADLAKAQRGTTTEVSAYSPALERVHDATVRVQRAQISLNDKAKDTRLEHIRLREAQHDLTVAQARARESNGKSVTSNDELKSAVQRVKDAQKALKEAVGETARETFKRFQDELKAARDWSKNMRILLGRGVDPGLVAELAQKGPRYTAQFVNLSDKELRRLGKLWRARNHEVDAAHAVLMNAMKGNVDGYIKYQMFKNFQGTRAWKRMTSDQREALKKAVNDGKVSLDQLQTRINRLKGKKVNVDAVAKITLFQRTKQALLAMGIKGYGTKFLAQGGPVRGPGTGTSDSIPASGPGGTRYQLSNNEHIWSAREVRNAGGHRGVEAIRAQFRAAGGPVGQFGDMAAKYTTRLGNATVDRMANKVGSTLSKIVNTFAANTFGSGPVWKWLWAQVKSHFPSAKLISAFRPGARTHATGAVSYHALGKAIDITPSMAIFNWIAKTWGPRTAELIYSPAGRRQIHNGRPHMYTGVTRADHWNHVHWAMRNIPGFLGFGGGGTRIRGSVANIVRGVAARYRWSTGSQWSALSQLISHESGWNPLAQNPTSSAFGLFQFLNGTWRTVGGHKTSDPFLQSVYGLKYILQRYNSPVGAWAFWRRHRYYHQGGRLPEDIFGMGRSGTTYSLQRGETVTPRGESQATVRLLTRISGQLTKLWRVLIDIRNGSRAATAAGGGGGGVGIGGGGGAATRSVHRAVARRRSPTSAFARALGTALRQHKTIFEDLSWYGMGNFSDSVRFGLERQWGLRRAWKGDHWDQRQLLSMLRRHNYDRGGWLQPGWTMAYNGTGKPERVTPSGGGGDFHIHFHGPVYGGKAGAQELIDVVVQGIAKKARLNGGTIHVTGSRTGAPVIR